LRGQRDAVRSRRVRNVADHLPRAAVDHHDVGCARHENAAGARFGGEIVGAAVTADAVALDFKGLRGAEVRPGSRRHDEYGPDRKSAFGHVILGLNIGAEQIPTAPSFKDTLFSSPALVSPFLDAISGDETRGPRTKCIDHRGLIEERGLKRALVLDSRLVRVHRCRWSSALIHAFPPLSGLWSSFTRR